MALTIKINKGSSDIGQDESGADYVTINPDTDYLIFCDGSDVVADGEAIPSDTEIIQAGTIIDADDPVEVDKCFIADIGDVKIYEVELFGNVDKQYVFCFSFDASTASEPVLEIWDDEDMDIIELYSLGEDTPSDSWWKGIVTTDGSPGADWANGSNAIELAGASDGHFLWLNNESGALSVAKDLYCNLAIIIPAGFADGGLEQPCICIKYTTN